MGEERKVCPGCYAPAGGGEFCSRALCADREMAAAEKKLAEAQESWAVSNREAEENLYRAESVEAQSTTYREALIEAHAELGPVARINPDYPDGDSRIVGAYLILDAALDKEGGK